ncbi:M56 family metallopeptidase [Catenovulum adriaticum]|uniref:M48 family metalloprotease n=1 Tax=Catenovulum adriaticum TaxID=2984846 RepID=A0ABY7ALP7_9ALTE|nr:M56 family metallopeptidase [Catenovulum sp. TS8]WAJ70404.1 M48 family metalloprotease [Catenovulum sp. TS8]
MLFLIASILFVWVTFFVFNSLVFSFFYGFFNQSIQYLPVNQRLRLRLFYGLLPVVISSLALFLFTQPELIKNWVVGHCHDNVCAPHWLHIDAHQIESVTLISLSLLFISLFLTLILRQVKVSKRYLSVLNKLSIKQTERLDSVSDNVLYQQSLVYRLVESDKALAWCAGLFNPQIYVSRLLVEQLSPEELNMVLMHEYAHAIRHDNLRKWLIYWASWCWPKQGKVRLKQDYLHDTELACDLLAVTKSGQVNHLATAIEQSVKLASGHCQNTSNANQTQTSRISDLQRENRLIQSCDAGKSIWALFKVLIFSTLILLVLLYFGHPFLEWISN